MVTITLDHSAMILYDRHPVIEKLKKLDDEGKLSMYHAQNLNRDLGALSETEGKIYERLKQMVSADSKRGLNLAEHGDLVLLINHMKSKRDYFLTMNREKYASLSGHRSLDIRFPDSKLMKEIESRIEGAAALIAERNAKKAKAHAKAKATGTSKK